MRKTTLCLILILACLVAMSSGSYRYSKSFIATAISVNAGVTKTNVADFTSVEIDIMNQPAMGALTVTFTRAAGGASAISFYFEVSADGGLTWSTFEGTPISITTNHDVISGTTVRSTFLCDFGGISHIRLAKIVNADGVNNTTAVNVAISF